MARRWLSVLTQGGALRKTGHRFRPAVEALEDRLVPSSFATLGDPHSWPTLTDTTAPATPAVDTVTSTLDDGSAGTLRAVIAAAAPGDTIAFDPSLDGQTITLSGEIALDKSLTIQGPGASLLTISGNNAGRIFDVAGAPGINVTVSGLTLTGGSADNGGAVLNAGETLTITSTVINSSHATSAGGGVYNQGGALTLQGDTISGNSSAGGGGGVFVAGGTLTSSGNTISANTATASGGGLGANAATVTLQSDTVSGNSAGGQGGGLDVTSAPGPVQILGVTVSGNTAANGGGGIAADAGAGLTISGSVVNGNTATAGQGGGLALTTAAGTLTIDQTTVSGNKALAGGGGGVSLANGGAGAVTLSNSTLSGNRAGSSGNGGGLLLQDAGGSVAVENVTAANNSAADSGGGLFLQHANGSVQLVNSTLAGNSATTGGGLALGASATLTQLGSDIVANNTASGSGADLSNAGTILVANDDLVENGFSGAAPSSQAGNIVGSDPLLGPLQNNGGPTQTMLPQTGSPAIDAGSNPNGLANDQRGAGYPRVAGTRADIGAVEADTAPPTATLASAPTVTNPGSRQYTFTVRFTDNTAVRFSTVAGSTVQVTGPNGFSTTATFVSADVSGDGPAVTATYHFTPPGGKWQASANGSYTLSLPGGQVADTSGNATAATTLGTVTANIGASHSIYAVGTDGTGLPLVSVYDAATGMLKTQFLGLPATSPGGVRVATGDVNGDGIADIICAAGPGAPPLVNVFDGSTYKLLYSFYAYDPVFRGGVTVAAGDVEGVGHADIITGTDAGGGTNVKVFSGTNGQLLRSFVAYDPSFAGGVNVAAGDVNGDGHADIITGIGPGGGNRVEVFDGVTGQMIQSFVAFDPSYTGGVEVAASDLYGKGFADIITAPQVGGGGFIEAFSGRDLSPVLGFQALGPRFPGAIHLGTANLNGDGQPAIMVATARPWGAHVLAIDPTTLSAVRDFLPFSAYTQGAFVS